MATKKPAPRKVATKRASARVSAAVRKVSSAAVSHLTAEEQQEKEIRDFYRSLTKKQSFEAARKAGIYTPKGRLTVSYK
ncbi:MAG TPA: hypothetical protein VD865_10435 [Stenotrophomonas sp.]|nr:hypothetical protein [Stenotrophomonas sp.]